MLVDVYFAEFTKMLHDVTRRKNYKTNELKISPKKQMKF